MHNAAPNRKDKIDFIPLWLVGFVFGATPRICHAKLEGMETNHVLFYPIKVRFCTFSHISMILNLSEEMSFVLYDRLKEIVIGIGQRDINFTHARDIADTVLDQITTLLVNLGEVHW